MSVNDAGGMHNLLRLAGLKNVSGRRKVLPGAQFLQDLENYSTDVEGTSSPEMEMPNIPQAGMEGELPAQSYDVRANEVMSPESEPPPPPEEEGNLFTRVGRALADYVSPTKRAEMQESNNALLQRARGQTPTPPVAPETPPIETAQVDLQEGLPPVTASQQESALQAPESSPGVWGAISDYFSPTKRKEQSEYNDKLLEKARNLSAGVTPESMAQAQKLDHEALDKAQMEPWQVVAYGATDEFAKKPELIKDFEEYTGIDFTPEVENMTKKYEEVLSNIDKGLLDTATEYDEQAKRIKERILQNQATDADKFYIGLALLMPLIIGGIFGKEAGLGALGGSAKGLAQVLGKRSEDVRKDEESLSDIYKRKADTDLKRGELEVEKLKVPSEIKKLLPKDEFEDIKGMNIHSFKDPQTGEIVAFGPEVLPDLYADLKFANTPEKRKSLGEKASKLEDEKAALERANEATSDIIHAAMQLKQPGIFSKILAYALSEDKDGALKKIVRQNAPDIMVDGRKQNSAVYIDSKIEQMKDAYRRNEQMRAFTNTVANHIGNMASNPQYEGLRPEDLIDQMLILRDRGQRFFVDRAASQGFLREPLENNFGKLNRKLYSSLNQSEEKKELARDKQLMYESE